MSQLNCRREAKGTKKAIKNKLRKQLKKHENQQKSVVGGNENK